MRGVDLAEWLLAQYDAVDPDDWHDRDCASTAPVPFRCDCDVPERVRADIAAKRQIVRLHDPQRSRDPDEPEHPCNQIDPFYWCGTLRLLAYALRDCDGYDPAWRPDDRAQLPPSV